MGRRIKDSLHRKRTFRFGSGLKSDQMISFTDMLATLADLVGEDLAEGSFDSQSFLPVLEQRDADQALRNEVIIEKNAILSGRLEIY